MVAENMAVLLFALLATCAQRDEDFEQKSLSFKKVPVEKKEGFPDVEDFFKNFVIPRVPVVFRDESFVFVPDFGESDLSIAPLSFTTFVRAKKKGEINSDYHMSVRQFLKRYRKEELHLDDAIPTNIKSYVSLPRCLHCKIVFDELLSTRLLFHHGKQEGRLLATERNFLGCQVTGTSEIHFFSPVAFPEDEVQDEKGKRAKIQTTRAENKIKLNMDKENQTYFAKLKAGDCVYIPALWLHQWKTNGNSVNVGFYWSNKKIMPTSAVCVNQSEQNLMSLNFKDDPQPDLGSLFMFDDLHHFIKNYFLKNEEESITLKTFERDLQKDQKYMEDLVEWNSECSTIVKEMFQQMDVNGDGFLSLSDFDKLSYKDLEDMAGMIDDRLADFEDIFEDQAAEKKGSLSEIVKNSARNYEKEFRNMIDEEFEEIFHEMESVSKDQNGKKTDHALKYHETKTETAAQNEESESTKSMETGLKDSSSQKRGDNEAIGAKENIKLKSNDEPNKDEL